MNEKTAVMEAHGASYSGRLNVPDEDSERGILVIPGAGHGPFGDVFDRFATTAAERGHLVARFETWTDHEDLSAKTDSDFRAELEAGAEFLQSSGCSSLAVVAKSFGGRLALTHLPDAVDRVVLWAPAVLFGEHDESPSITASELATLDAPVRILQGDEDDVVSVENAAKIADALPDGELVTLSGEDHSFLNDERRTVDETLAFLPP